LLYLRIKSPGKDMKDLIKEYNKILKDKAPGEVISFFASNYPGKVSFSTSMGAEDQVLTDILSGVTPGIKIFTLDTGRLFQETYDLMHITEQKYGIRIHLFFPDPLQVEKMVNEKGVNLFYESVENRRFCCNIRKIESLKRALSGMDVWITGVRKEQSVTREDFKLVEWDESNRIIKVSPLIDWTESEVWDYLKTKKVPYNELHDEGYPSIGCQPCTRAVKPGAPLRSGRWWWELPENKECGLH
jgi:phosphoadenosine phosphosulfate reductase